MPIEIDVHGHTLPHPQAASDIVAPMHRGIALALVASACHVTVHTETTHPGKIERIQHAEGAIAHRPTLVLTDAGLLRFVEPLECPTEEIVETVAGTEVATRPNLATFVIGIIATSIGGVLAVRGLASDDRSNPATFAGIGGLGVGLPLAIGPWIGTRTVLRPGPATAPVRRPGPSEPCGARALVAKSATLTVRGIEVHGAIDRDGVFSISPYQLVDAFDTKQVPAWDVSAVVDAEGRPRTVTAVLESGTLTQRAPAFLATATFDSKIEPMRLVPGVVAGTLRVSMTSTRDGPALRVVLPIKNDGPGDAWAVRGQLTSPTKAVDGRVIYVGHLAKGAAVSRELLIPLTQTAADSLKGASIEVSIELRDAHGTAPQTPVRFRGSVLGDAPR